jgi:hypothetical protein
VRWQRSDRFDPALCALADRHYSRRKIGSPQFVPPGRCVVLRTEPADAVWVTSWPFAEYVRHAWAGAWVNSIFRNEAPDKYLSSGLIREAVAATLSAWPRPPSLGLVTMIDPEKTRRKRDPGRCYIRAGFKRVGYTKGGLVVLQMLPKEMPEPCAPDNPQGDLLDLLGHGVA